MRDWPEFADAETVSVLGSAAGLGVYIPALMLRDRLRDIGISAEVQVLEAWFDEASRERFVTYQSMMRSHFKLALYVHRNAGPVDEKLDQGRIERLFDHWQRKGCRHFAVWCGYWLPVLARYAERFSEPTLVRVLCRIDALRSASFEVHQNLETDASVAWLRQSNPARLGRRLRFRSALSREAPGAGQHRLLVHGGGWGLGEYRDVAQRLGAAGFAIDLVVHSPKALQFGSSDDRCLTIEPGWQPWVRNAAGEFVYPPMIEIRADGSERRLEHEAQPGLIDQMGQYLAIVSKPGGCTLIDSLETATPVVLLSPYGHAEAANGQVWAELGFGLQWDAWSGGGYDASALESCARRLRQVELTS